MKCAPQDVDDRADQTLVLDDQRSTDKQAPQDNLAHDRAGRSKLPKRGKDRNQSGDQDAGISGSRTLRAKEVEITPEMVEAGVNALRGQEELLTRPASLLRDTAIEVFVAMVSVYLNPKIAKKKKK